MARKSEFRRLTEKQRALVEEYAPYAKSLALRYNRVPRLADDCICEAMVKLAECAARYDPSMGNFKTFVYWQIRGHVNDFLVGESIPRGYRKSEDVAPETNAIGECDFGEYDTGIDRYELREAFEKIAAKIACPVSRGIVRLWILEEYSHEEIAAMRGCSLGNIRYYWKKAREQIQAAFARESKRLGTASV